MYGAQVVTFLGKRPRYKASNSTRTLHFIVIPHSQSLDIGAPQFGAELDKIHAEKVLQQLHDKRERPF
jgi:hypothetical protein